MGHISQASRITSVFSHDNSRSSNGFKIDYFGFNAAHVGSTHDSNCTKKLTSGKIINFNANEQTSLNMKDQNVV